MYFDHGKHTLSHRQQQSVDPTTAPEGLYTSALRPTCYPSRQTGTRSTAVHPADNKLL